jgi:hypothetical protein
MDFENWFSYGVAQNFVEEVHAGSCSMGMELIYLPALRAIETGSEAFDGVRYRKPWADYGVAQGWVLREACVLHNEVSGPFRSFTWPDYSHNPVENSWQSHWDASLNTVHGLVEAAAKDPADSFIDIGCGPATILNYVYKNFAYGDLGGIEKYFYQQAVDNRVDDSIWVKEIDATSYDLPDKKSHVYLFNPFSNTHLIAFVERNLDTLRRNNSLMLISGKYSYDHVLRYYGAKVGDELPGRSAIYTF